LFTGIVVVKRGKSADSDEQRREKNAIIVRRSAIAPVVREDIMMIRTARTLMIGNTAIHLADIVMTSGKADMAGMMGRMGTASVSVSVRGTAETEIGNESVSGRRIVIASETVTEIGSAIESETANPEAAARNTITIATRVRARLRCVLSRMAGAVILFRRGI
jgi:hypothetical protein